MPLLILSMNTWVRPDVCSWIPGSNIDPPLSTKPSVQIPIGSSFQYIVSGMTSGKHEELHVCLDLDSIEIRLLPERNSSPFIVHDAVPASGYGSGRRHWLSDISP